MESSNNRKSQTIWKKTQCIAAGAIVCFVLFRLSGCSLDQDLICIAGYRLRYETNRPDFNFMTMTSLDSASQECATQSFNACIVNLKSVCVDYQNGKSVDFKLHTGHPAPPEMIKKNMEECPRILAFDPRFDMINADNEYSWWIRSCAMFTPYDQCLDDKGFSHIAATHLRCKALNIIR